MLTIYTGNNYSHKLASIDVTYAWPEEKRSAYEQFDWFDLHIDEFREKNTSIKTFSPYILNYLNLIIAEGKLNFDDLEVICIHFDEENNEYFNEDLKVLNYKMIDTRFLSDPISEIYQKFNEIKNNTILHTNCDNGKENNNSYCQEHCKGYQETGRCFADGECQAKKNAESAWSKGDEYILETIAYTLKRSGYSQCIGVSNEAMIDWLTSIKDKFQKQWKPSDSHIRYLQSVVNDVSNAGSESCHIVLKDLLEHLKKYSC